MRRPQFPPASRYCTTVLRFANTEAKLEWASDSNTPRAFLCRLAYDISDAVRQAVAENPCTPRLHLMKLASDYDPFVVIQVVKNPNTPLDAIIEVVRENAYMREREMELLTRTIRRRDRSRLDDLVEIVANISDAAE